MTVFEQNEAMRAALSKIYHLRQIDWEPTRVCGIINQCIMAIGASAAEPQVVADELTEYDKWFIDYRHGNPRWMYLDNETLQKAAWNARAALQAAPVQVQEQWIDKLSYDAQVDEWAIEKGNLEREIEELKFRAPAQPVAMPNGEEFGFKAVRLRRTAFLLGLEGAIPDNDKDLIDCMGVVLGMIFREVERLAAPAAQGDAIRKVEVDDQGPLGVVTKTTYVLANAKDAKDAERWREALQYVGADRSPALGCDYFVLRGIHVTPGSNLMRGSVAGHFTSAIDAAIDAKAAS